MAFGIDDALTAAAGSISLGATVVETVKRFREKKIDYDFEQLIEEVRVTTLKKIDDADFALTQFERMLVERGVNPNRRLSDIIAETSFWHPFEQRRLNQIRKQLNDFSDSLYTSADDIAALARCRDLTDIMGKSVVDTTSAKHELHSKLLNAKSLRESIDLLRNQLAAYKKTLGS